LSSSAVYPFHDSVEGVEHHPAQEGPTARKQEYLNVIVREEVVFSFV